jgi:hypothetical protein
VPRRTLLSSEQRARLFSFPIDAAEMARYFVLSAEDLILILTKRRAVNRLGFAIQLCALRHPGRALDPAELPPEPMLAFVGKQVGVDPAFFGDYARRAETRREHMIELQKLLRLRTFGFADWRSCLKAGADAAWATDRGEPIVQTMIAHLRANNVLLPTMNVLERIGLAARARARKKVFEVLADGLTAAQQAVLEKLLAIDPELRRSRFAWLRDYSESPAPSNIVALLDRLEYARGLGFGRGHAGRIHPDRLNRLVGEGAIMTVQHIIDLEPARRTAMLVAQAASLETRLSDVTLAMFEKYMGTLFSRARNRDERRFRATRQDVAKALLLFRRTIAALRLAKETGEEGVAVVDRKVGMKQLDDVLPVIGSVANVAEQDILITAAERYSVLRRFSPRFLKAFDFRSSTPNGSCPDRHRNPQGDGSRQHADFAGPAAFNIPVAEVAQAHLRERQGGPAAIRNRRARHAARPPERQRHLGRWQPRLPRLRGLPAASRGRAGHRRDRSGPLCRRPRRDTA